MSRQNAVGPLALQIRWLQNLPRSARGSARTNYADAQLPPRRPTVTHSIEPDALACKQFYHRRVTLRDTPRFLTTLTTCLITIQNQTRATPSS